MTDLMRVRAMGFIEACSAIALFFVAMPLKYLADMPKAVTWIGSIHGFLWVAYALTVILAYGRGKLPAAWVWILGFASLIPFGPFLVDGKLKNMESSPPLPLGERS
jgi:integral membrane protein